MRKRFLTLTLPLCIVTVLSAAWLTHGVAIPDVHKSNKTEAKAEAKVAIAARTDSVHTGVFRVKGKLQFDPASDEYPVAASLSIKVDLSDSAKGTFFVTTVEQLDSIGKHTPTVFATGRCKADIDAHAAGLRYWLMMTDNKRPDVEKTPDVISFLIYDRDGKRVAYGTGPVNSGDVQVAPGTE